MSKAAPTVIRCSSVKQSRNVHTCQLFNLVWCFNIMNIPQTHTVCMALVSIQLDECTVDSQNNHHQEYCDNGESDARTPRSLRPIRVVPRVAPHVVASTEPTTSAATDADACYGHRDGQQQTKDEESHNSLPPVQGLQTGGAKPAGGGEKGSHVMD